LVCNNSLLRSWLQQILLGTPFALAVTASAADSRRVYNAVPEPALVIIETNQNTSLMLEVVRQVKARSQGLGLLFWQIGSILALCGWHTRLA
jgi:hypothetical protein